MEPCLTVVSGRFIPAPAGNAVVGVRQGVTDPVHPRACGERAANGRVLNLVNGSSPRLRGTQRAVNFLMTSSRFIPAPAGNAVTPNGSSIRSSVHPRACGERSAYSARRFGTRGSSPRLRGTPQALREWLDGKRFIPAPAGNAVASCTRSTLHSVHPRACGERLTAATRPKRRAGSSPRLRGTLAQELSGNAGCRFIPAPAGNASSRRS